jgi:hypothetical protein
MVKKLQLSHTKMEMYELCPAKYKLHYIDYIRQTWVESPLFFGLALDEALNRILLEKKKELTSVEKEMFKKDPKDIFDEKFTTYKLNGEDIILCKSEKASFSNADFEYSLLQKEDKEIFTAFAETLDYTISEDQIMDFYEAVKPNRKEKTYPEGEDRILYNNLTWLSLRRKGHLMLEAFSRDIMPEIVEVHEIQKKVNLEAEDGDFIMGYIDYIATMSDGKTYVMDNKSSSKKYKEDSVAESQQLALYSEDCNNLNCGYSVILKKVYKREPFIRTQLILDKMPEETLEKTFDKASEICYSIRNAEFPEIMDNDNCFQWGRKCAYYKYCRSGDVEGLKKLYGDKK